MEETTSTSTGISGVKKTVLIILASTIAACAVVGVAIPETRTYATEIIKNLIGIVGGMLK